VRAAPDGAWCALLTPPTAGAPVETLHMTCAEVNSHLYQVRCRPQRPWGSRGLRTHALQVKTLADEIGIAFLGLGFQPKWSVADTPAMPKARPPVVAGFAQPPDTPRRARRDATKSCASTCPKWAPWAWT